ncbi:MAG: hypothetical protein A2Y81_01500 [Nitrospirae bacterium RBG_13_43_8]|nr:MAG: hypothetical protein A2Y81_01500 [Nitrospirae bacterium RBG_13_43_8]
MGKITGIQVEPTLLPEVRKYGNFNLNACYNCGTCTVTCPLTSNGATFSSRKSIHATQIGAKKHLLGSLDPWLCYYCGDCSTLCPRQTEPGEAMMTLRRYLTAQYDWTGLSAKFYKSVAWEIGALFAVAALVLILALVFHGPVITERVTLNTFAPVHLVHTFDLILLTVLSLFLISNASRMFWFTMVRDGNVKIPLYLFITEIKTLLFHAVTQLQLSKCNNKLRWIVHWFLTSGYVLTFIMVVFFLKWFQVDNVNHYYIYLPRLIGYYGTTVIVIGTVEILIKRLRKREQMYKFSELSDWIFPVLLLLTTLSGIAIHVFMLLELPLVTYYIYVIHLMIAVPMLVIEVPFSKWAHLAYRPLAIYFQMIKEKALQLQERKAVSLSSAGKLSPEVMKINVR